jgi:hypothetical protein
MIRTPFALVLPFALTVIRAGRHLGEEVRRDAQPEP